jgi:hypothetical protein
MAELRDNIGRMVTGLGQANMSLEQINSLLKESLQGKVGEAKTVGGDTKPSDSLEKIKAVFEQFSSSFKSEVEKQSGYISSMKQVLEEIRDKKESKEDKKGESKGPGKSGMPKDSKIWDNLNALAKKGLEKGSIYTHDQEAISVLGKIEKTILAIANKMKIKVDVAPPKAEGDKATDAASAARWWWCKTT